MNWVEVIGYAGSLLVIASLAQSRIVWLRLLSLCGSVTFLVYAVLIESAPIALTNAVLMVINLWHLWRLFAGREDFSLLEVSPDSAYLRRFLEFHADEIAASQPDFSGVREGDVVVMVLRDMVPTLVVVGRPRGNAFRVYLDYAIPSYRDFKGGRWLYEQRSDFFHRFDVSEIVATGPTEVQRRYLRRAGFEQRDDGRWVRPI
ncbi:MAG TPA: YgjV family protein [Acidimicrobiia bacterium]